MSIFIESKLKKSFIGTTKVKKMFLGSTQIWVGTVQISVPTLSGTYTYNGSAQTPTWSGYDSTKMSISGTTSATNAGTYSVSFTPLEGYSWDAEGEETGARTVSWSIAKATGSVSLSKSSMSITGAAGTTGTFTFSYTGDGSISVSSSNTGVCTVSRSGTTVTCSLVASGSATVTVSIAAGTNYTAASATCTVTATVLTLYRVGGRIFYDAGSNGNTYTFYDSSKNVLSTQTVAGLANAYYYTVSGSSSTARWYVYDNTTHTYSGVTFTNGLSTDSIYWGYSYTTTGATTNSIGSGKTNTTTVLNLGVPTDYTPNVWGYIKNCRDNSLNGCSDWFIASEAEQDQLRSSGLVTWYSNYYIWSSVESSAGRAYRWYFNSSAWGSRNKDYNICCFAARAF